MDCSVGSCDGCASLCCHGCKPTPALQRSPTTCAQWQPTGRISVVYARTHWNTARDRAGSSPKTAWRHAEITDPGTVPIAFRVRCIGRCALHTSRQHHQAKLAPQHSTVPLLKKALDSSTSSAAPPHPKTPMCIHGETENVLREEQVAEQQQHVCLRRACAKTTIATCDTPAQART